MNRKLAETEACYVTLDQVGGGPTLRVPQEMVLEDDCGTREQPKEVGALRMSLSFPGMHPASYGAAIDRIFTGVDDRRGSGGKQFTAKVYFLFYPRKIPGATSRDWSGMEPEVWQQIENDVRLGPWSEPKYLPSKIEGLRGVTFGPPVTFTPAQIEEAKRKGWNLFHEGSGSYVDDGKKPFVLLMACESPEPNLDCQAHVQIVSSRLQYRIEFPATEVTRSVALFESVNAMISSWIVAPRAPSKPGSISAPKRNHPGAAP